MIAAPLLLMAFANSPEWFTVGETSSRLRVFVDRASIRDIGGRRRARVRIGAPHSITGRIVVAYEDEEFDCTAHRWRLLGFEARDEDDKVVQRGPADLAVRPMLPVVEGSMGGEVARTVCSR